MQIRSIIQYLVVMLTVHKFPTYFYVILSVQELYQDNDELFKFVLLYLYIFFIDCNLGKILYHKQKIIIMQYIQ